VPPFTAAAVRRYYDRHTSTFVRFGQGTGVGAIHRAVWGPGTATLEEALHYAEGQIATLIDQLEPSAARVHVVDLGCGIGASLCHLAAARPVRCTGVTLSPVQAQLAAERVRVLGLGDRVTCIEGDYCDLPDSVAPADVAFAIESFVHGPSPVRFFAECSRIVRPGGWLVICDDFRRPTSDPAATRWLQRFARGWHINTLLLRDEVGALADHAGFERTSTTDLTPWLELGRPRDRWIAALAALAGWLPSSRVGPWLGGSALQTCLRRGWLGYDLVVFRRREGR